MAAAGAQTGAGPAPDVDRVLRRSSKRAAPPSELHPIAELVSIVGGCRADYPHPRESDTASRIAARRARPLRRG
jgi:hypothetical protein